jgi:hypothetical protein
MSRRGGAADRPERLRDEAGRLVEAVLGREAATPVEARRAALGFEHASDRDRRRGAELLRRQGYRLPRFLLR